MAKNTAKLHEEHITMQKYIILHNICLLFVVHSTADTICYGD